MAESIAPSPSSDTHAEDNPTLAKGSTGVDADSQAIIVSNSAAALHTSVGGDSVQISSASPAIQTASTGVASRTGRFDFFQLSGELRNQIYAQLSANISEKISCTRGEPKSVIPLEVNGAKRMIPHLWPLPDFVYLGRRFLSEFLTFIFKRHIIVLDPLTTYMSAFREVINVLPGNIGLSTLRRVHLPHLPGRPVLSIRSRERNPTFSTLLGAPNLQELRINLNRQSFCTGGREHLAPVPLQELVRYYDFHLLLNFPALQQVEVKLNEYRAPNWNQGWDRHLPHQELQKAWQKFRNWMRWEFRIRYGGHRVTEQGMDFD